MKRLIAPLLLFFCVCFLFLVFGKEEKEKVKKIEPSVLSIESVDSVKKTLKEQYKGTWVNTSIEHGSNTLSFSFLNSNTVKITYYYDDFYHITPVEFTTTVTLNEEGKGSFTFLKDNWGHSGKGDLFLEGNEVSLYINTTKMGAPYGVLEKMTTFHRVDKERIVEQFKETIKHSYKTTSDDYLPRKNLTYMYRTLNGEAIDSDYYHVLENGKVSASPANQQGIYEVKKDGLYFKDQFKNNVKELAFPLKKGEKWSSGKRNTKKVLDDDYTLFGLEHVIVIENTNYHFVEYYHKDFGLVGYGDVVKGKHKPNWLLQTITKNDN